MTHPFLARSGRAIAAAVAALLLVSGAVVLDAQPASAAPRVSITVKDRPGMSGVADSTYLTEVVVSGTGFQSIQNGFGGIYVLFGWADQGSWRPSQGGHTGSDYRYVYDDESNPVGYQLFVSFPGSSTGYANNGGYLSADGSWSTTMKIPGPRFQAYDRAGNVTEVDCLAVQCGIMTIGAHGVLNAANESFTPIAFQQIYSAADGRSVAPTGGAAPSRAVAPTVVGGRPATIPGAIPEEQLTAATAGGVTASVGETLLTLTAPGADPERWLGVYFYSEPLFAGWFKPNSAGVMDISLPGNLPDGDHRVVLVDTDGAPHGWAPFAVERTAAEPEQGDAPAGAQASAPSEDLTPLLIAVIVIGVLALAAVGFFAWVLLRGRRRGASPQPAVAVTPLPVSSTPDAGENS